MNVLKNLNIYLFFIKQSLMVVGFIFISVNAYANPTGGAVAAGDVTIQSPSANTMRINQTSQKAIINWQSFNIGASDSTHFQQPAGGVILNRINAANGASQIYGRLTATGQVILVNPAGIYFGPSAYVNVGGLIATTSNISNMDFLSGNFKFVQDGHYDGSIVNEGTIIAAKHGLLALIGANVTNTGLLEANLGHVVLASGSAFTMSFAGNDLISFSVDKRTLRSGNITNTGTIRANGGSVLVTANTALGVLDNVINMQGYVEAKSVTLKNGKIRLGNIVIDGKASQGVVRISAHVDASGKASGQTGGHVAVMGNNIIIAAPSLIRVSGDAGGGSIKIGGDYQGKGSMPTAKNTTVQIGANLDADAITHGNGGKVIVWADETTHFHGMVTASGGALSGNGGFVETSGKHYLDVAGARVNLGAAFGKTGTWLLDPTNLTIQTSGTSSHSILTVADLQAALMNASVIVQTGTAGAEAGDITVLNDVTWSNSNTLTLSAYRDINIFAAINNSSGGSLSLRADNTGTGVGTVLFSGVAPQLNFSGGGSVKLYYNPAVFSVPTSYASNVNVSGGSSFVSYMLINNLANLQNMSLNVNGNYALGRDIDASATNGWNAGAGFAPISTYTGNFDGNNHVIANLYINRPVFHVGLFGVTNGATISNVNVVNANVTGNARVGILAGYANNGTVIRNSHTSGEVTGFVVGGLVGVLGDNNPSLTTSHIYDSNSSATIYGSDFAGGLAGTINSPISNSYSTGDVFGGNYAGGFVGWNYAATIQQSWSSGNVTGLDYVGGFIGLNDGVITQSYSLGNVNAGNYVAGFVGANTGSIDNSYSLGNATGADVIGGLVGYNTGAIDRSFSSGEIDTAGTYVGGLVGYDSGSNFITYSYWDIDASGLNSSSGGTGLTSAEMKDQESYIGFDFTNIWAINPSGNYPVLKFQNIVTNPASPTPVQTTATSLVSADDLNIPSILMRTKSQFYRNFANGSFEIVIYDDQRGVQQKIVMVPANNSEFSNPYNKASR